MNCKLRYLKVTVRILLYDVDYNFTLCKNQHCKKRTC